VSINLKKPKPWEIPQNPIDVKNEVEINKSAAALLVLNSSVNSMPNRLPPQFCFEHCQFLAEFHGTPAIPFDRGEPLVCSYGRPTKLF
jgi:hypothetical protein